MTTADLQFGSELPTFIFDNFHIKNGCFVRHKYHSLSTLSNKWGKCSQGMVLSTTSNVSPVILLYITDWNVYSFVVMSDNSSKHRFNNRKAGFGGRNVDRRKEKSRYAARDRRGKESDIFVDLQVRLSVIHHGYLLNTIRNFPVKPKV